MEKAVSQSQGAKMGLRCEKIITRSMQMEQLLVQAYRVVKRYVSVLICGASGTVKEPFGDAKGSFTCAINEHKGLFKEAVGGTLFLDEIGDMPTPPQVKLLRALQEQIIRTVGSSKQSPTDARIISATHKNFNKEMQESKFRENLYYRLNVVNITLPTPRERSEDIPLLARHPLKSNAERHQVKVNRFSDDAMQLLVTCFGLVTLGNLSM
jgi:two-component system response regulator GlrR